MKWNRDLRIAGLALALLTVGVGYSIGQSPSSPAELNNNPDGTTAQQAGLVVREVPMDMEPGELTPPGLPAPGETPVPTPGQTPVPTPVPPTPSAP